MRFQGGAGTLGPCGIAATALRSDGGQLGRAGRRRLFGLLAGEGIMILAIPCLLAVELFICLLLVQLLLVKLEGRLVNTVRSVGYTERA